MEIRVLRPLFVSLLAASAAAGCAGDSGDGGADSNGDTIAPVYAMVTLVWRDDGPTGYVALMNRLDAADVSLETAREYPGYTSVGAANGQLRLSPSAEGLTIER